MAARATPLRIQDLVLGDMLEQGSSVPSKAVAPGTAKVQRRGRDAVLEADDVDIIVYELFQDRA